MRLPRGLVTVLAVAALVGGCGDDETTATTTTTAEATTTTTTAPSATSTTDDLAGEGIGDIEAVLAELLITADELGDPAPEDTGYSPAADGPCADIDSAVPPIARVGTTLAGDGQTVIEELRAYATVDDAVAAAAASRAGSSGGCGPPTDVVADVGGDEADIHSVEGGLVVVARAADVLAAFWVYGDAPRDPLEVAAFGVGRVLAFLEQGE